MKPSRRLALRRETLTDLTNDELSFGAGVLLTLQANCSVDDVNEWVRYQQIRLTLHPRCSWSCI